MRYVSLFSGIEAATAAWEELGFEPLSFCEIDEFPSAVLAERYPAVPNLGDVTKIDWGGWLEANPRPALVVGGSPCQSFSVAGTRTGLAGASGLMWEYVRAVQSLRPRWLLWENVPGALSSTHGEDFGCLLRALDECGYGLAWRVLDAQFFGVAQRRLRLFLVGSLGEGGAGRACEVLFEPHCLRRDSPSGREKRQALAAAAGGGAQAASFGFKYHVAASAGTVAFSEEMSPTQIAGKPPAVVCMTDTQPNTMVSDELCGALTHRMHKDPPVASYAVRMREGCAGGGKGPLVQEDVSGTLATGNDQTIFTEDAGGYIVRRLTPLECERLQGFPDGWTRIPYRGRPADECPDTPRYKALGNSMAVPVMRWIGERVRAVDCLYGTEEHGGEPTKGVTDDR